MGHLADRFFFGALCQCPSGSAYWRRRRSLRKRSASDRRDGRICHFALRSRATSPWAAAILAHGLSHKDLGSHPLCRHTLFTTFRYGLYYLDRLVGIASVWEKYRLVRGSRTRNLLYVCPQQRHATDGFWADVWRLAGYAGLFSR